MECLPPCLQRSIVERKGRGGRRGVLTYNSGKSGLSSSQPVGWSVDLVRLPIVYEKVCFLYKGAGWGGSGELFSEPFLLVDLLMKMLNE